MSETDGRFGALRVHPALARALAGKGYAAPTGVQEAVMDPACANRDLLVSSQTGSGKTVAFGLLIAETALAGAAAFARDGKPRALVVAPTRELALQVRNELAWLFRDTRARVQAFTGGTDTGRDVRTLHGGVEIAVGTPGRLVDLIERKALDLGALAVLVLDEGDEMLDLGFRDELEAVLAAAPAARRTHLFSATLPPEIRRLAARYQQDALSVDPRGGAADADRVHGDIQTVMHLVAPGDRLPAVVNVLRAAGEVHALVFCSRRDRVASLTIELAARGFDTVGLSGEMSQAERNRALEAVRDGRARVLAATDVAARGLDLPDLGLVIHADLPVGPEVLVHRSGRTGRAGRKGTSVIIAEVGERLRAERILRAAHITPAWTEAPPATEIARADRERLWGALAHETASMTEVDAAPAFALADRLLADADPRALLAALVARELGRMPAPEVLRPVNLQAGARRGPNGAKVAPRSDDGRQPRSDLQGGVVLFSVNLGRERDRAEPGWLLPLICRRGGVTRREVGAIRVGASSTTFEVAAAAAKAFATAAAERDPRAPNVVIEALPGTPPAVAPRGEVPTLPAPRPHPGKRPAPTASHAARPTEPSPAPPPPGPFKPGGKPPFKPGGKPPFKPGGKPPFKSAGERAFKPGGKPPFKPVGERAFKPGGKPPFKPVGERAFKPGGKPSFKPRGDRPGGFAPYAGPQAARPPRPWQPKRRPPA